MKTINGNKVTCSMVVEFDFTKSEADQFLAAPPERRCELMNGLLSRKHPNPETVGTHICGQFYEAIGKAMIGWRESELKQLKAPESTEGGEA